MGSVVCCDDERLLGGLGIFFQTKEKLRLILYNVIFEY